MAQADPVNPPLLPCPRHLALSGSRAPALLLSSRIESGLPPQGYRISIDGEGARVAAADAAGLHYARQTLQQLEEIHGGELPSGRIEDHPDQLLRGVMLDISRDKVPTLATLKAQIDRLASWKINHVQLYMEHSFAYPGHEEVSEGSSPLTGAEISELDQFCRERFVELAPNQNCLGHMERWLKHERYVGMAISSAGSTNSIGVPRPPMTLDPADPRSFALIAGLLRDLLPCFSSRRVHVGLDETWELPGKRLTELVEWVDRLRRLPVMAGRELLVWGDMFATRPDLLAALPPGVTLCEWGYEADHPFDERARDLADRGIPFWIAPGTSSWLSIVGRVDNGLGNCLSAAEAALKHGAAGFLITDWGDNGHLQQPAFSDPALAYGAGLSWYLEGNRDLDLARILDLHCYRDSADLFGTAIIDLGRAYSLVEPQPSNMSALTIPLYYPQFRIGAGLTEGLTQNDLNRVREVLDRCARSITSARIQRSDGEALIAEAVWSVELMSMLVEDASLRLGGDGTLSSVGPADRERLAGLCRDLLEQYDALWRRRNRPGGLLDSRAWLERLLSAYDTGSAPALG